MMDTTNKWTEHLQNRAFEDLDRGLNALQRDFESGKLGEQPLREAFYAFGEDAHSSIETALKLDNWVRRYPESYAAHLTRGVYLANDGHRRRGAATADKVQSEQWQGMFKSFSQARDDLTRSLELTDKPVLSYVSLMKVQMVGGGVSEGDDLASLYEAAIQVYPASFAARRTRLQTLRPEWGGDLKTMRAFAADPSHTALPDDEQKKLQACLHEFEGHWFGSFKNDHAAALEAFSKAIDAAPSSYLYARRATAYASLNRLEQAYADLEHVAFEALKDDHERLFGSIAYAVMGSKLHRKKSKEAVALLERAVQIDPSFHEAKAQLALQLYSRRPSSRRARELAAEAKMQGNDQAAAIENLINAGWFAWLDYRVQSFFSGLRRRAA